MGLDVYLKEEIQWQGRKKAQFSRQDIESFGKGREGTIRKTIVSDTERLMVPMGSKAQ